MRYIYFIVYIVITLSGTTAAQSGRIQPTPTPTPDEAVKIETEEIKLSILALDEDGKYVKDVTGNDIVITDNNILHQPETVRRIPANVLIVLDTGGELRWVKNLDHTRRAAAAVIEALAPGNNVAILQYSDKAELVGDWTDDKNEALGVLRKTKFGLRSAFVEAIDLAIETLLSQPRDNRHLVLITDGTDSFYGPAERLRAMRRLLSTDISVHVISYTRMESNDIDPRTKAISNSPPPRAMPDEIAATLPNGNRDAARAPKIGPTINMDRKHLERMRNRKRDLDESESHLLQLVENTNGTILVPLDREEMVARAARISAFINASYVITYIPKVPVAEGPAERTILVTSKREGLVVQAKRRFLRPEKP
ncbi:VWA domain-containing protein [Leptolyngbya sp. 7M]|uniref:VWA domain-containing protein n=1 Tax=Leptolyngbya sp. 7M TaxID=2812896 RepID=UPI001B8B8B69|nr:VWA domain-containing protein [Leptolyngbya sp. 7M]QYO66316.1 VWA domain-containing protein [Leptolyngbya sp. 7M]